MTKQKFRKKPVVIEAYQTDKELDIETLEGTMHASIGDWIITGLRGEPYPCKPDIFEKSYEPVVEVKEAAATTIEQEPSCRNTRQVDLISRQAAIDAVHSYFKDKLDGLPTEETEEGYEVYCDMDKIDAFLSDNKYLSKRIENLPSAEPKGSDEE